MIWRVYYYTKTSFIEIAENYIDLSLNNDSNGIVGITRSFPFSFDQDILFKNIRKEN